MSPGDRNDVVQLIESLSPVGGFIPTDVERWYLMLSRLVLLKQAVVGYGSLYIR